MDSFYQCFDGITRVVPSSFTPQQDNPTLALRLLTPLADLLLWSCLRSLLNSFDRFDMRPEFEVSVSFMLIVLLCWTFESKKMTEVSRYVFVQFVVRDRHPYFNGMRALASKVFALYPSVYFPFKQMKPTEQSPVFPLSRSQVECQSRCRWD